MTRKSRLGKNQIEAIQQLRAAGAELHELADLWGVTPQYIHLLTVGIRPDPEGRRMRWFTKEGLLQLFEAWRPALPTEGLPLPNWIVKRGVGSFPWSKNRHSPIGKTRKAARMEFGKLPGRNNPNRMVVKRGCEG